MELSATDWTRLVSAAKEASLHAYCPYSKFAVGAALMDQEGRVFSGCNVENASYGLTICAERNAIFRAATEGMRSIRALLVYAPTSTPSSPCGACRQVISEFGPEAMVRCICNGPGVIEMPLSSLLPSAFGPANL